MNERSFFEKTIDRGSMFVAFVFFMAFMSILFFGPKAFGAETDPYDPIQIRQEIDELKSELVALKNNKLPANIEFCGERVPQERGYVRERLDKELTFISRKQFALYIKRASYKYFPYIEKRLKEWNMPDCLKYISVIESALLPNALSNAKAGGYWQFIPETARRYGLKQNINWDDRADFEKATDAALGYLWDNYKLFGSWALAIAAYNAGEATVGESIKRQPTAFDYYDLLLPAETMQYNYRAIVAYLVMSKPEAYGLSLGDSDLYRWPEVKEATITLLRPKYVADIAADLKISLVELLWLNPQIRMSSGKKTFKEKLKIFILPRGTYTLKIPKIGK